MFSLFKKTKDSTVTNIKDGLIETKAGNEIAELYKKEIDIIYDTLQLSRDNFNNTYLPFIESFTYYIQTLPCPTTPNYDKPEGLIKLCLLGGLNAVKKRRGFILPPGTRTDIQDKQRSVWSYAIFTSAVIVIIKNHIFDCEIEVKDGGNDLITWSPFTGKALGDYSYIRFRGSSNTSNINLNEVIATFIHTRFIPEAGLKWLMMDDALFKEWCACATGNLEYSDWIRDFCFESYYCPTVGQTPTIMLVDSSSGEVTNNITKDPNPMQTTINNRALEKNEQQALKFNSDIEASHKDDTKKINEFLTWMESSYNNGDLFLNQRESTIHSVDGGIFTAIPTIFKKYKKELKINDNDIKELEVIIMNNSSFGFIKSDTDKNIHVFNAYGKVHKGFMINPSVLGIDKQPLINKDLSVVKTERSKEVDSF